MWVLLREGDGERHYPNGKGMIHPPLGVILDMQLQAAVDDKVQRLGDARAITGAVGRGDEDPAIGEPPLANALVEQQLRSRSLDVGLWETRRA